MSDSKLVGSFGPERDLDEQQLAEMRPAIERAPRPRKPRVLREVTNGIMCFCGERFGEHQALEFMLHLRAEVGEDLALLQRHREYFREYHRKRRATDPEYRARDLARSREFWARKKTDPEWRERDRQRRADPEYRKRRNERDRARAARKKAEREAAEREAGA